MGVRTTSRQTTSSKDQDATSNQRGQGSRKSANKLPGAPRKRAVRRQSAIRGRVHLPSVESYPPKNVLELQHSESFPAKNANLPTKTATAWAFVLPGLTVSVVKFGSKDAHSATWKHRCRPWH